MNIYDWFLGAQNNGNQPGVPAQNMNLNLLPQNPLQRPNPFANNNVMPQSNPTGQLMRETGAAATPQEISANQANPAGQQTLGQNNQQDSLRKMLMMQALMSGGEDPMNAISGGQPSGAAMRGSGGFQNDPNAGLLNSFPPQMAQRKRFLGGMGGGY